MLKNKKGFTLIELIAVVTIMAIIALLATPNIISMIENGKKEQYVSDAKEFISKATYMYKLERYKSNTSIFKPIDTNTHRIYLTNIEGVSQKDDPYGYEYQLEDSYIQFKLEEEELADGTKIHKRNTYVYLKSCKPQEGEGTECITDKIKYIKDDNGNPVKSTELTTDSVKE